MNTKERLFVYLFGIMVDTYLNLNTFDVGPTCWDLKTFKKSCSDNADVFFTETVQALPGVLCVVHLTSEALSTDYSS